MKHIQGTMQLHCHAGRKITVNTQQTTHLTTRERTNELSTQRKRKKLSKLRYNFVVCNVIGEIMKHPLFPSDTTNNNNKSNALPDRFPKRITG